MRPHTPTCPKCGRPMHPGFMLDGRDNNRRAVAEWVAGAPERSFWTGLRISNRSVLPVTTFRCEKCGFLESYAAPPG